MTHLKVICCDTFESCVYFNRPTINYITIIKSMPPSVEYHRMKSMENLSDEYSNIMLNILVVYSSTPVTVAEWLQWLTCPLPTGRCWIRLGSNHGGNAGGVPDHA